MISIEELIRIVLPKMAGPLAVTQDQARGLSRLGIGAELSGDSALPAVEGEELCGCSAAAQLRQLELM